MNILKAQNIYKRYNVNTSYIINNLSFNADANERIALVGANGSGKTTLLRLVSGIIAPEKGCVEICGQADPMNNSGIRKNIGVLFSSENSLYDRLSVKENSVYYAKIFNCRKDEYLKWIDMFAEMFDMKSYLNKKAIELSRGMRQKALLMRAIIHQPKLLLLDEPSSGMDIESKKHLINFINTFSSKRLIIFSSHDMDEIREISTRVIYIQNGSIISDTSPQVFFRKHKHIGNLK